MKRIDLIYGGQRYSISGREYADVQSEIISGISAGGSWLSVNVGEGSALMGHILITAGVDLTLIPVSAVEAERHEAPETPPEEAPRVEL